ncbi:MAG: zf-TFIIB domain-containing protein [Polyangiaceae bacterium]|nr:zf-TFIIB domain-containing protein [Polyangiaceae bacterium]
MTSPRSYSCPVCGGAVDERSRACSFCAAPIASVCCAHCFHWNVPESIHCAGCGRALGLEPIGEAGGLDCPECAAGLAAYSGGPGRLLDCARCGGQFVEHALLRDLCLRRQTYGVVAPRVAAAANPLAVPVRYLPCPACRSVMNRQNFGGASGVVVDVCRGHGVWFSAGELPIVLSFVEAGGLIRARHAAAAPAATARHAAAAPTSGPSPELALATADLQTLATGLLEELGQAMSGWIESARRR